MVLCAFTQQPIPLNEKRHLDSLEKILRTNSPDSTKAKANFSMVEYWKYEHLPDRGKLISNAVKHARPSNVMLQCSQNDPIFFITFEDDGSGFDTAVLTGKKGMGLDNIKNRIEFLKGKFELQSGINEGTTINIELNTDVDF